MKLGVPDPFGPLTEPVHAYAMPDADTLGGGVKAADALIVYGWLMPTFGVVELSVTTTCAYAARGAKIRRKAAPQTASGSANTRAKSFCILQSSVKDYFAAAARTVRPSGP